MTSLISLKWQAKKILSLHCQFCYFWYLFWHFRPSQHRFTPFCHEIIWAQSASFLKFIYSEKATKFWEISTLNLTACTVVKFKVKISQKVLAFSEYIKFNKDGRLFTTLSFTFFTFVDMVLAIWPACDEGLANLEIIIFDMIFETWTGSSEWRKLKINV